jgi:hypothetical protein
VVVESYPTHNFIAQEFQAVTGTSLPKSAKILKKYKSDTDIHGDLESCAVIAFNDEDYKSLMKKLVKLKTNNYPNVAATCDASWFTNVETGKLYHIDKQNGGYVKKWGITGNENEIFYLYTSW